jgi:hypothetical protein
MTKVYKLNDVSRLDILKDWIIAHRAKAKSRATYELYAINVRNNELNVRLLDHAPTSADFAPMIKKGRIAAFLHENDYIVEFRGAWKSDTEGKVVAYESEELANR